MAVRYITFDGNDHVSDKELRQHFKIKEDRWWRSGEYKEDDYRLGLDSLMDYYRTLGYLDASVTKDSVIYASDKKNLDIRVSDSRRQTLPLFRAFISSTTTSSRMKR